MCAFVRVRAHATVVFFRRQDGAVLPHLLPPHRTSLVKKIKISDLSSEDIDSNEQNSPVLYIPICMAWKQNTTNSVGLNSKCTYNDIRLYSTFLAWLFQVSACEVSGPLFLSIPRS